MSNPSNPASTKAIKIGVTEARSHFADMLKRVHRGQEHLIVEKRGFAVAALIGMQEYGDFVRWQAQKNLRKLGQQVAGRAQMAGVDEANLAASLETDRRAVYEALYGSQASE